MDLTKAQMNGRSIKIKNIGMKSIYKTVITDAVTGEPITNVSRVEITLDVREGGCQVHANVTLREVPITSNRQEVATTDKVELELDGIAQMFFTTDRKDR